MENKRRWFQIHLSTAIILTLAAGVVLWANTAANLSRYDVSDIWDTAHRTGVRIFFVSDQDTDYGWPKVAYEIIDYNYHPLGGLSSPDPTPAPILTRWNTDGVLIDALGAGFVLLVVTLGCEAFVRRLERHRAAKSSQTDISLVKK